MKKLFGFCFLLLFTISCERDDICPETTMTTPRLSVAFYDINIQDEDTAKNVGKCRIQGVGNDAPLSGYEGSSPKSAVLLPLKTTTDNPDGITYTTQYSIIKGYNYNDNGTPDDTSDDIITGNEDIITITYTTEQQYVSRACGYRTVFNNVRISVENDSDNWIRLTQAVTDNLTIQNELSVHYKIYH